MMYDFRAKVEQKWGRFQDEDTFYIKQKNLAVYSPRTFLNVLFKPIAIERYAIIEEKLHCKLPTELVAIYKHYNGVMLFSQTLRIYGVSVEDLQSPYKTLDFIFENVSIRKRNPQWNDDMVSFGYYGSRYRFCFNRNEEGKFYVIDRQTLETVHVFDSIANLLKYYVEILYDEYDVDGMKIHKNPDEEEGPLRNISMERL